MKKKILLIEDDRVLANVLADYFVENDFAVMLADSCAKALEKYHERHPALILSDVRLPDGLCFDLLKKIRDDNPLLPILIMTGTETDLESQKKGYALNAYNYMTKPVVPELVLMQVRNLLKVSTDKRTYRLADATITLDGKLLDVDGQGILLREKEAQLLSLLLEKINSLVTRKEIMLELWKDSTPERSKQLDVLMSGLKKQLQEIESIQIAKQYGKGYVLVSVKQSREPGAKNQEQRTKSKEQRVKNKE